MKKIKVLITGPSLQDQGGVANYYNAILPYLSARRVQVHYLEIGSTSGRGRMLHVLRDQFQVWRAIRTLDPEIIHVNPSLDMRSFIRDGLFIFLSKLRRKPVIVFFRGWQVPFEKKVERLFRWFFVSTYLRADGYIVLANRFSGKLREWGVTAPVYLGSTAVADELLTGFSLESKLVNVNLYDGIKLLYLARLERDKGILELIEAVILLLEKGLDVSLTVAGEGMMLEEVRKQLLKLGRHAGRIRLIGYVRGADKVSTLQSSHVYCFPTQYGEGMPNSVLEAMGFGLPVITCAAGGLEDFFQDTKMGVLLQGNTPNEIAGAIESLIADPGKLAAISRFNYEFIQANYLASKVAERLCGHYLEILGRR